MTRIKCLVVLLLLQPICCVSADTGRIKRKPPGAAETERIVSDMVMNDGSLQKGDIVVTDRGFFVFRGLAADGVTGDFMPVANPLPSIKR
jgi:hypothetical protein